MMQCAYVPVCGMCEVQGKLCRSVFLNALFLLLFHFLPLIFLPADSSFHCSSSPWLSCIVYTNSLNLLPVPPCSPYLSLSEHPSCSSPEYISSFLSSLFNYLPVIPALPHPPSFFLCHLMFLTYILSIFLGLSVGVTSPCSLNLLPASPFLYHLCTSAFLWIPLFCHILISLSHSCVTSSSLYLITGSHPPAHLFVHFFIF